MFCPKCGADNQDGIKFCKKCGASMIEGGAELATSTAKASAKAKSGPEKATFILGIVAAGLLFVPIPLLAWFSVPCAVVGFIFAFMLWTRAKYENALPTTFTIVGIVLCSFVILNFLAGTIHGSEDFLTSMLSSAANGFGNGLVSGLR